MYFSLIFLGFWDASLAPPTSLSLNVSSSCLTTSETGVYVCVRVCVCQRVCLPLLLLLLHHHHFPIASVIHSTQRTAAGHAHRLHCQPSDDVQQRDQDTPIHPLSSSSSSSFSLVRLSSLVDIFGRSNRLIALLLRCNPTPTPLH